MPKRVLFVSKPVAPPFHDGTKCLVRDVALNLSRYEATVMVPHGATGLGQAPRAGHPGLHVAHVYADAGAYTPALADNARAAAYLAVGARADLWHFVFAPNPRSSAIGRIARAVRRTKVVQTVASAPRRFSPELFFGDAIVAQSNWTAARVVRALAEELETRSARRKIPLVRVIPPPVGPLREVRQEEIAAVARKLELPAGVPVFVYPGDLEVSTGADTVARAVPHLAHALPDSVVVFACRPKTPAAPRIEAELRTRLDPSRVRFSREIDLPALLARASVVLFPVDDLYGKVDLPISLLEAMSLGVPVVGLDSGPLADLAETVRLPAGDAEGLARSAVQLHGDRPFRERLVQAARRAVADRYDARVVAAAYERVYDEVLRSNAPD
jgi:phosphatidylinositol alpha-1,6-mannosyltransferase